MSTLNPDDDKVQKGNAASKEIPVKKRVVVINEPGQLPLDYGTTPGGTIYSTTPGGTRIVYERKFLLQCRNSPHSMSPPCNLPTIPGVTEPAVAGKMPSVAEEGAAMNALGPKENIAPSGMRRPEERGDGVFEMDM